MNSEHHEIVKALIACKHTCDFNRMLINKWRYRGVSDGEIGSLFKVLYQYREQCPDVYQKHIDHPYCKPR